MKPTFKKISSTLLMAVLCCIARNASAQTETQTTSDKIENAKATTVSLMEGANTLGSLRSLLPKKKAQDTVFILVSNIKLTDPNLTSLKSSISKDKKNILASFKDGITILKLLGKRDASAVYDNLNPGLQKMFAVSEMEDNRLLLDYKPE